MFIDQNKPEPEPKGCLKAGRMSKWDPMYTCGVCGHSNPHWDKRPCYMCKVEDRLDKQDKDIALIIRRLGRR